MTKTYPYLEVVCMYIYIYILYIIAKLRKLILYKHESK